MGLKKLFIIPILISLVLLSVTPALANSTTASAIAKKLICQCDCGRVLDSHVCTTQEEMVTLIKQKLAQGQSEAKILDYFVAEYGEQVLAAPPKRGFNLIIWIAPFVALLLGGGIIYITLRKWVMKSKTHQTNAVTKAKEGDEEYQHRLKKELEEFTGRGFR